MINHGLNRLNVRMLYDLRGISIYSDDNHGTSNRDLTIQNSEQMGNHQE